jgi:hypothetical protein
MITRRTVVGGIATLAASEACAQRLSVIGAPAFNKYSNEVPWSLDTTNNPISSFVPTTRTHVIPVLGQSNNAQYANAAFTPPAQYAGNIFQLLYGDGTTRKFVEPAFGPGTPPLVGSWMGQYAVNLLAAGKCDDVLFCFGAIGGTRCTDWGPPGKYHSIITTMMLRLRDSEIAPTMIIVGQGETETFYNTPGSVWRAGSCR